MLVLLEFEGYGYGAGVDGWLKARDREGGEGGEEEGRVGGLDVLINVRRCLFEDQGPEIGDLGDERLALCVERGEEGGLCADWESRKLVYVELLLCDAPRRAIEQGTGDMESD